MQYCRKETEMRKRRNGHDGARRKRTPGHGWIMSRLRDLTGKLAFDGVQSQWLLSVLPRAKNVKQSSNNYRQMYSVWKSLSPSSTRTKCITNDLSLVATKAQVKFNLSPCQ